MKKEITITRTQIQLEIATEKFGNSASKTIQLRIKLNNLKK